MFQFIKDFFSIKEEMPYEILLRQIGSLGSKEFYLILSFFILIISQYNVFLIIGFIFLHLIISIIRFFFFKQRPIKKEYMTLFQKIDASSMPSAHSARASFLALFISNFFNNIFLNIYLFILVLIISYSRIYRKKHDYYDILVGIFLGIITYVLMITKFGFNIIT